jgi:hypothetical protein
MTRGATQVSALEDTLSALQLLEAKVHALCADPISAQKSGAAQLRGAFQTRGCAPLTCLRSVAGRAIFIATRRLCRRFFRGFRCRLGLAFHLVPLLLLPLLKLLLLLRVLLLQCLGLLLMLLLKLLSPRLVRLLLRKLLVLELLLPLGLLSLLLLRRMQLLLLLQMLTLEY